MLDSLAVGSGSTKLSSDLGLGRPEIVPPAAVAGKAVEFAVHAQKAHEVGETDAVVVGEGCPG